MTRREAGGRGERIAAHYLEKQGMEILDRNVRIGRGELDLIATEGETLVFVEVKARSPGFVRPSEAITPAKIARCSSAAIAYLTRKGWLEKDFRFDVVEVVTAGDSLEIEHLRSAFEFDGRTLYR